MNQYSKPWFCEILRDTFRDGCQCLRTSVDYLIFLITLQVCKFLDVTSVSPTPLRKYFATVAAIVVFFGNNVRDSQSRDNFSFIISIYRATFWFCRAIYLIYHLCQWLLLIIEIMLSRVAGQLCTLSIPSAVAVGEKSEVICFLPLRIINNNFVVLWILIKILQSCKIKKRTRARAQVSVFTTFGPNSQWMKANQRLTQQISFMSKL